MDKKTERIFKLIMCIVAIKLDIPVSRLTWEKVEELYASGEYPEINAEIDYIIG